MQDLLRQGNVLGAVAPAYVQGASNSIFSGTTDLVALSRNVTANNVIAVIVDWGSNTGALDSITDNCGAGGASDFYVLRHNPTASASNSYSAAMAYAVVGKAGPCTVTASFSADPGGAGMIVNEISGIDTSSPLDASALNPQGYTGAGTNAATSGNVTTSASGDYMFGGAATFNGFTMTAGTNCTLRDSIASAMYTEGFVPPTAGSVAATFNTAGDGYLITGIMAFKPAGGGAPDTTPPSVPSGLTASAVSSSQINLSWIASTDVDNAASQISYTVYRGGAQIATVAAGGTAYSDTGLSASTSYSYAVSAQDPAGNSSGQTAPASATTQSPPPPDTTPPTVPTNLSATAISSSQINLAWTASTDNVGVTGYKVYRGGIQVGATASTNYSDTGLAASTLYSYTVSAYDAANNNSNQSAPASATTQAAGTPGTVIDPSRSIDWSAGNVGVAGGIPNRSTVCATLNPGATAAQINTAIANCASGGVVFLNAGIYNLSSGISLIGKNNITLRGAGPDQTKLIFGGSSGCIIFNAAICLSGSNFTVADNAPSFNWTAGYVKGATQITVNSTAGMSVGSLLVLDQLNDATDNGNLFVEDAVNPPDSTGYSQEGGAPGRGCGSSATCRAQHQYVKVTAINGNTVTITPGLYMPNWRASQNPGGWIAGVIGQDVSTLIGVEGLSVDGTSSGDDSNIELGQCYQCWIKNVRSIKTASRNHVWIWASARDEVRDSYFYGSAGTSQAYGVEAYDSGDNLVINNIMQHTTGGLELGSDVGSVWAYNYALDNYYTVSPTWMISDIAAHDAGDAMILLEGNVANALGQDDIHGNEAFVTAFRNQLLGLEPGKNQQTTAATIMAFNRYSNLVGNVLGTAGYHNTYQVAVPGSGNALNTSIYSLGYSGAGGACCNVANDPAVINTLMRWGNYDTVNGNTQWNAAEVPSALAQYANPLPGSQVLPASLFLTAKPSWWGSTPWPAIGPDVTGGNIAGVGGHAYAIPAEACFNTSPIDNSYLTDTFGHNVLLFNANNCYGSGGSGGDTTPPSVPTGLAATAISSSAMNL